MTEVVLRDVPIRFPFKPYKVQEDYMSKVLECLQQGVNGVLESPTGTGKTLSLLCSSLAWLQTKKAQLQANAQGLLHNTDAQQAFNRTLQTELQKSAGVTEQADAAWSAMLSTPQIIYASRTHAQLTQVMQELKRTSYAHVKAAVLGSRDQLCLHTDLLSETGFMKVAMCRAKVTARSCHFHNNLEMKKTDQAFLSSAGVADIEDLMKLSTKAQCCPYYLARELMSSADIVFMPYNYLLNPHTRQMQQLNLNNAVVILDEAHNVEKMCEESASVQISSTDIALCIAEVTQVMKKCAEDMQQDGGDDTARDFSMEDLCLLKTMFLALEAAVDEIPLDTVMDEGKRTGKTFPAAFIFELLAKAEIQMDRVAVIDNVLTNLAQFLSTTSESPLSRKGNMLTRFNEFLKVVFASLGDKTDTAQSNLYYKVYVEPEVPKKTKGDIWSSTKATLSSTAKVVNFWCFSPGFAMRSLLKQGVHCVILTSGTLSPLHATVSELAIPIPVQLENPHIIQPSQVSVSVLSKGPTREKLVSNFSNRDNPKYLGDLGRILINFCRVVPDGVLMFFPSYPCMEKTVNHWQEEGFWSQIIAMKPVFVEPQRREGLAEMMRDFATTLETQDSRGAVFLAVLRGKVSEGMDFADKRCRAVLITGLPYPPFKDPRVMLKREYVDNLRKTNPKGLSGRDWYELEATRAVNQAVGRVIRHNSDFGAIVLCDSRFESPSIVNTLSAWLRPHIIKCPEFGPAYGRICKFFKAMGASPPVRAIPVGASFDSVETVVRVKEEREEEKPQKENQGDSSLKQFLKKMRQTQSQTTKPEPQPSASSLFTALDISTSQSELRKQDVWRTVLKQAVEKEEESAKHSYVQPAVKKRKLRMQCVQNYTAPESDTEELTLQAERQKSNKEYLLEVKGRLSEDKFRMFGMAVQGYTNDCSYNNIILSLHRVFPDKGTRDLFIGFKRYIKPEHASQFEDLCFRLFGTCG